MRTAQRAQVIQPEGRRARCCTRRPAAVAARAGSLPWRAGAEGARARAACRLRDHHERLAPPELLLHGAVAAVELGVRRQDTRRRRRIAELDQGDSSAPREATLADARSATQRPRGPVTPAASRLVPRARRPPSRARIAAGSGARRWA